MTKKVPFIEMPDGVTVDTCPPDGLYATISHGQPRFLNPFPWRTTIYEFKGGVADKRGGGSNAGDMLSVWDVAKVFLIGLDADERAELDKTLVEHDIELVPSSD